MEEEKYYCQRPGCQNEIAKPQTCCNGFDCGCMGQPIEPPFCSNECYDKYMSASKVAHAADGGRPVTFGAEDELAAAFRGMSPEQINSVWKEAVPNKVFDKFKPVFLTGTKGSTND